MSDKIPTYKIVIIGDSGVGKSSLVIRYVRDEFNHNPNATIGLDFSTADVLVDNKWVKLQIIDSAGQERFSTLPNGFLRGSSVIILAFDVGNYDTYTNINKKWYPFLTKNIDSNNTPKLVLLACKVEPNYERRVDFDEAFKYAQELGALFYIETSAKEATYVDQLFNDITTQILKHKMQPSRFSEKTIDLEKKDSKVSEFMDNEEKNNKKKCAC